MVYFYLVENFELLILVCSFHGFGRNNDYFVPAFRTNIGLTARAGKAVAARF